MKKMEKHLKRALSILLVAVFLVQAAWTPTTSRAATNNEATAKMDVYVSADGSDSAEGTQVAPLKTLAKAFEEVATGGTVHIDGTVETGSWSATGKNITITGGTLNFTTDNKTLGGLGDTLTFKNITLGFADAQRVFANGCKLIMDEGVVTTNPPYLFGGCDTGTLYGDTHLEVYSGNYKKIYGGGNDRPTTLNGSTHVIVGGTVNEGLDVADHDLPHTFYGGGMGDTITGSTNITVTGSARAIYVYGGGSWSSNGAPTVKGETHVVIEKDAHVMGVYGGNNFGGSTDLTSTGNVNVLMTGGSVEQIFGGNYKANLTGDVDVRVLGGTVTRRIYGGNYNEYKISWSTNYSVTGNIKLAIGGNVNISYAWEPDSVSDGDEGVFACSRLNPQSSDEKTTLIYDVANSDDYNKYTSLVGPKDTWCTSMMNNVDVANNTHYYTYTADDEANTITATCNLCAEAHLATATLSAVKNQFAYTGNAIEGAQISYDETWNAAPLEITYTDNVEDGIATATCTKNGASVSVSFKIQSTVLSGKTISILGDSISTYDGVSNNANMNKTIGKNNRYYEIGKSVPTQNLTYWGQLIEKYGMNLCVNNSTGGGKVSVDVGTDGVRPSGIKRSTELHNNDGQEPDIILVNMGTNDLADEAISLTQFGKAYKQMLDNMLEKYENAEVFCFTLLPGRDYTSTKTSSTIKSGDKIVEAVTLEEHLIRLNNQIERIVAGYEDRVTLVDMYTESGIAWNNLKTYMNGDDTDGDEIADQWLHPNTTGMAQMANVLERALLDVFEPTSLPGTPDVYFDLDIDLENNIATDVGTNKATIQKVGNGSYTTKSVVYNGQTCEVPVFYASKNDKNGSGNDSYLDVAFNDITTANQMESWILDKGITFEAFLWVENQPKEWSGIMSNISGGGIALHALATDQGNANFFIGTNDGQSKNGFWKTTYNDKTNYRYAGNYSTAAYLDNTKAYTLNTGTFVHVVGTYDNSTNMMSLYHNGQLIDSGIYAAPFKSGNITQFNHLGIGTGISVTKESLDDTTAYAIADARVYSGGLTAEQVKQEYNNRWNEVLKTATGPEVYFDLDFEDGAAVSTGTNAANTTITSSGNGNITTMKVVRNGQLCEVPVYYAPKDSKGTSGTDKSYLDVKFKNIADITDATDKEKAMTDLIFKNGISFECFIYVDEIPKGTAGFMTSLNAGGIGFYSYNTWGELNFRLGTKQAGTAAFPFDTRYAMAFPSSNAKTDVGDGVVGKLQLAQEYQTLNAKQLTHVVGTYDVERNVLSIYKNGELISEGSYGEKDFKIMVDKVGHIGLGANIAYESERMDKYTSYAIADARIYSGALTAKQVAEQYNNRWDDVAAYAVSGEVDVNQLTDLDAYTIDSTAFNLSQDLGEALTFKYGSVKGATYEGSNTADRAVIGDSDYTLHVFSNTTPSEYISYLKDLKAAGWMQYSNNIIEDENLFATYTKDGKSIYAYYIASKASTYIVVSDTSNLENRQEDNQYEEVCEPLFTELKNISSSQCEIVRLSDGRFIVIDSGVTETDHYQAKRIYEVMEEQNVLDKITVAAWIITHPHTDHMNACADFLEYYGAGDLDIEEIIFNYPNKTDREADDAGLANTVPVFFDGLAAAVEKWPEMKIITCHTGQEYYIADATIEILHTVEDYFPMKAADAIDGINDVSVAFKIKIADQEIMILGDGGESTSNDLVTMWGDYLKSDFLQAAHHGMVSGITELYEYVDPTVVTIPATRGLWDSANGSYIGKFEATAWVLNNLGKNIKEVSVAGLGTRTFTLPYTPNNKDYISNINDNGYDMKEAEKVKVDTIPEPYMDLVFEGNTVTDGGTADNTLEMTGGSVGENTVYYKGQPYTVTSYRGEKTSSNHNYIKVTMNDITSADDLKDFLLAGHTLEMFFALDNELPRIGGLMASANGGGVALYAKKLGVLEYRMGNTAKSANTYYNDNYAFAANPNTTNSCNIPVGKTVTHVVATYDKEAGMLKVYENGVLVSEGTYNNPELYKAHGADYAQFFNQIGIGANIAAPHEAISRESGYTVIKSRIYDETLSAEQVASEYWSCIEELTGEEVVCAEETVEKVTVPFTKTEAEYYLEGDKIPTRKDYLFGGWYTTNDIPESTEEAIEVVIQDTISDDVETVYALFVPKEVMTVRAQISSNLIDDSTDNDETGAIRFTTTVDSLMYKRVGLEIVYKKANGEDKVVVSESRTVYEKMYAVKINGELDETIEYFPTDICAISRFFKTCTFTGLTEAKGHYDREFTITPYWETMDGSIVYGESVVKSVNQYLETMK